MERTRLIALPFTLVLRRFHEHVKDIRNTKSSSVN